MPSIITPTRLRFVDTVWTGESFNSFPAKIGALRHTGSAVHHSSRHHATVVLSWRPV